MTELVLSSIPEFWPENDKDALYLGPWCFAGNKKYDFWDASKFNIVPSPISSKSDTIIFSRYVDSLIDRLIPSLSKIFNEYYGTSFSDKFWQVSLTPFLLSFLNVFYLSFKRLERVSALCGKDKINVKILKGPYDYTVPSFSIFTKCLFNSHEYNFYLFSQIIKEGKFVFLEYKEEDRKISDLLKSYCNEFKPSLIEKTATAVIEKFHSSDIYWGEVYGLSLFDRIKLSFSRNNKTDFKGETGLILPKTSLAEITNKTVPFDFSGQFEEIVSRTLVRNMPEDIFKGITALKEREKVKYWVGIDLHSCQERPFKIARIVENGGTWISSENGGGYGYFLSFPMGKLDYDVSRNFISWGWTHKHIYDCKIIPLPSPKLSRLKRHEEQNDRIVFVGTLNSTYYNRLHSFLTSEDMPQYLENKRKFLRALDEDIRGKVLYKQYFFDYGINEKKYLSSVLNENQFTNCGKASDYFKTARFAVVDHLMTSTLEAMAMGIPNIMYYDPEMYKVMDEIKADFDELAEAKLYFEKPEDAAVHVNNIYHDVNSWWLSDKVVKARERFTKKYALNSKDYLKDWIKFAKSLPE